MWVLSTLSREIREIQDNLGDAALSPDGSRIVFDRDQELWQMGPNAESPRPLAKSAGQVGYVNCSGLSWSPDARWLTYIRKKGNTDRSIIEALDPNNGRASTILADRDLRGYAWLSPTKIVLNRWEAPDNPFSNLWQIGVDPKSMKSVGAPQRLTNWAGFSVENMSASRDGKLLAISRETDQSNIFVGELADQGNKLTRLHRVSPEDRVEWPSGWSADSKTLFFQSDRTGNMNIFRTNIDLNHGAFSASDPEPVVMDQNDNRAPVLSSDKALAIYFVWPRSPNDRTAKLMRKPIRGGPSDLILEARAVAGYVQTPYWVVMPTVMGLPAFRCPSRIGVPCVLSEAGSHELVFYSFAPTPAAAKSELFRIPVDDPNSVAWDLSPDGTRVAYAQHEFGSASIHMRGLETKNIRDILLKGMTDLSTLSWAADGKSLFATTFAITGSSLLHITLDGKYRVLYKGAKEVEGARPSPDGRYLAFGDVVSASNVWLVEGLPK